MFNALNKILLITLCCTALIACRSHITEDEDKPKVGEAANPILLENGSLYQVAFQQFYQATDPRYDIMAVTIDRFAPSTTNIEPDKDDDDQTTNWLKYSQESWNESFQKWESMSAPLQQAHFQKTRPYREVRSSGLSPVLTTTNRPIYETIDDNIFERQLTVRFVWDFAPFNGTKTERNLYNDRLDDLEKLYGYTVLPHVNQWADIDREIVRFSQDAKIFAASRSVDKEATLIESVLTNNEYSLTPVQFAEGEASLDAALALYASTRLNYQFVLDYQEQYSIYISFDLVNETAQLYGTINGASIAEASLIFNNDRSLVEIDTQALTQAERAALHLPAYFNPVMIGPFESKYFYGKRYIKTTQQNRNLLEPMFFFNQTAKQDIEQTFKRWRIQDFNDRR